MPGLDAAVIDVAVIIVTYRSAALTVDCLRSIEAERATTTTLNIHAIVVDNDSGDLPLIAQAVETHGWRDWVELIAAPRNGGFAYGNNLGIARAFATGRPAYVHLLNPDTVLRPAAIGTLVRFLEDHPGVGIAGGSFEDQDGGDWLRGFRFPSLMGEVSQGLQVGLLTPLLRRWEVARHLGMAQEPVDWISGASMMIRTSVIETIGGLDENYFLYYEETDFCRRARQAGFSSWYVPESRVMHVMGHSTQVKGSQPVPRRLPGYWFESRRRYFVMASGIRYAMLVDVAALAAHALGFAKRCVLGRRDTAVPYFIRDLARHSVLWPRNRRIPAAACGGSIAPGAHPLGLPGNQEPGVERHLA